MYRTFIFNLVVSQGWYYLSNLSNGLLVASLDKDLVDFKHKTHSSLSEY